MDFKISFGSIQIPTSLSNSPVNQLSQLLSLRNTNLETLRRLEAIYECSNSFFLLLSTQRNACQKDFSQKVKWRRIKPADRQTHRPHEDSSVLSFRKMGKKKNKIKYFCWYHYISLSWWLHWFYCHPKNWSLNFIYTVMFTYLFYFELLQKKNTLIKNDDWNSYLYFTFWIL